MNGGRKEGCRQKSINEGKFNDNDMEYYRMTDFCCEKMEQERKDSQDKTLKDHSIIYDKRWRRYCIYVNEETKKRIGETVVEINYCPWCGVKLPKELSDKWLNILEKEYNILDPFDKDREKIPSEFRTDEWWKKRGL